MSEFFSHPAVMPPLENAVLDSNPVRRGAGVKDVPTPALLVDLDALRRNIVHLSKYLGEGDKPVALRPYAKTHKSPAIAALRIEASAVGICCQTVREVEPMAAGGVKDVLLANEIATADEAERLALAANQATVSVCVDHPAQVALLSTAARRHELELGMLVEIGGRRCGVTPGEAVVLACQVAATRAAARRRASRHHLSRTDEQGTFAPGPSHAFAVGDKIRFVPGHYDPTVNLHDFYVVYQGEAVVDIWPIAHNSREGPLASICPSMLSNKSLRRTGLCQWAAAAPRADASRGIHSVSRRDAHSNRAKVIAE
jgi:D-serine deaminase-like pyridoxal phosphate-dependent protein